MNGEARSRPNALPAFGGGSGPVGHVTYNSHQPLGLARNSAVAIPPTVIHRLQMPRNRMLRRHFYVISRHLKPMYAIFARFRAFVPEYQLRRNK